MLCKNGSKHKNQHLLDLFFPPLPHYHHHHHDRHDDDDDDNDHHGLDRDHHHRHQQFLAVFMLSCVSCGVPNCCLVRRHIIVLECPS